MAAALLRMSRSAQNFFAIDKQAVLRRTIHTRVWWDLNYCKIPDGCESLILCNIKKALANLNYNGPVSIAAYYCPDLDDIPFQVQVAFRRSRVSLIEVDELYKNASSASSAHILVDMFEWAIDHGGERANCLIISNDGGLSHALQKLGKHHNILLARDGDACPQLESAAKTLWSWKSLIEGEPPERADQ